MPFGLYEFTRMPFGLRNAAQILQRFMDQVLCGLDFWYTYIDDVLIASKTTAEHKVPFTSCFWTFCVLWRINQPCQVCIKCQSDTFPWLSCQQSRCNSSPWTSTSHQRLSSANFLKTAQRVPRICQFFTINSYFNVLISWLHLIKTTPTNSRSQIKLPVLLRT